MARVESMEGHAGLDRPGNQQMSGHHPLMDEFMQEAQRKCAPDALRIVATVAPQTIIFAAAGAFMGSEVPVLGTAVGAVGGAALGLVHGTSLVFKDQDRCLKNEFEARLLLEKQ